jgi:nucleotide-binding universal stress UspA family protein
MYHVLVPIDTDEDRAVAQARAVQNLPGARGDIAVTLLHVIKDAEGPVSTTPDQTPAGRAALETLREAGIGADQMSRGGDPAEEIVQIAREIEADAVVLGGRKRSPLGSLLFGSVTQAVILDADRPVMVTGDTVHATGEGVEESEATG